MFLVHEIFASVQGEGVRTGLPTVFVRLAGCNLGCVWCDTESARSEIGSHRMTEDEIMGSVRVHGIRNVCITGGEPFCHEGLSEMVSLLLSEGYDVDIETNGSFDVSELLEVCPGVFLSMDVKTPSSRMESSFEMANLDHLRPSDQLKFIISGEDDMDFALEFITKNVPSCHLVLTPCDNAGGRRIVKSLMNELSNAYERGDSERMRLLSNIRIMLQMHKVIWGNVRGV